MEKNNMVWSRITAYFVDHCRQGILCVIVLCLGLLTACGKEESAEPVILTCHYSEPELLASAGQIHIEPPMPVVENPIDFEAWWEQDPNVYAYIEVPNTRISYPILQSDDTQPEDYYLEHNLDGSYGYPGCIYSQRFNSRDLEDYNTILYGHNMNNGTGFHDLHKFRDADFFEENRDIYIYTPDMAYTYKVIAAYIYTNDHLMYQYDFETEEGYQDYLDMLKDYPSGNFDEDVQALTTEDRLLTLSTCTNDDRTRLLVQAKLVERAIAE